MAVSPAQRKRAGQLNCSEAVAAAGEKIGRADKEPRLVS